MEQHAHEDYLRLKDEFELKEKSMQERLWIDSTVGELDDLLRANYDSSVADFGRVVIEHLAQITNAYHGIFYIAEQEEKLVKAVAGFACKVEKLDQNTFAFGETIIGQAIISQEKIKFENLTDNTTQNTSLVGQLQPHTAIVIPLLFNQITHGVIELVFVNPLETRYELFLDRVGQNIGAMLESILNSAKMQKLLAESQQQSELLRSQEEELRQNLEEMSATREAQDRAQAELEHLKNNLEKEVAEQTKRLEESIQKFDLAMDATTEGLWDMTMPEDLETKDDTPFWWSNNFRKMLDYQNEEDFPNRLDSWSNLLHPDHKEKALEAFSAHLLDFSGQTPYDVEYQLLRKTGEYHWYRAVGNTLRDDNGKPLRVAGSLIDIQKAKDLEEIRKELVQKYDLAMETTTEGLWDMSMPKDLETKDDTPFWWSNNFRKMLGYTNEKDFPNRLNSWSDLLHPHHKEKTLEAFNAHLLDFSGQTPYDVEYQLLRKTGEYRWYRAVGNTLRDENGKPLRVAGSLIDIQKQKDLMSFKEHYELFVQSSDEGFWYTNLNTNLKLELDTPFIWSDNFRKLLEFESEVDFPNVLASWEKRLHPEDKGMAFKAFYDFLEDRTGQTLYDLKYRIQTKNGEYLWFKARCKASRNEEGLPLKVGGQLSLLHESEIPNELETYK